MALNIEKATLGYDANNVTAAINSLNTDVIVASENKLKSSLSTLFSAVDSVWVGQSAEQFKKNMDYDVSTICQSLEETHKILETELNQIVNKMDEVDQNLVQGRG